MRGHRGHTPKTGTKPVHRREGMRKASKEANQHDRATRKKGAKGVAKRLEGEAL
jgi:hypothetical protein